MERRPVTRVDRPRSRRLRDGILLALVAAILVLALIGGSSSVAFVVGANFASPGHRAPGSANGNMSGAIRAARHEAAVIIHKAEIRVRAMESGAARSGKGQLRRAHEAAVGILGQARQQAQRIRSSGTNGSNPVAAPVSSSIVTQPTPQPTLVASHGRGASQPSLRAIPRSWSVIAYGADPTSGTVHILNRSSTAFSGTVTLTFLGSKGGFISTRSGHFSKVQGHSIARISMGSPPIHWYRYVISVSGLH